MFVPHKTWEKVGQLFATARRHEVERRFVQKSLGLASEHIICSLCREECDLERHAKQRLRDIARSLKKAIDDIALFTESELDQARSSMGADETHFILQKADFDQWKRFATAVQRSEPRSGESFDHFVRRLLPDSHGWTPQSYLECSESDQKRVEQILSFFRPVLCKRHGSPVHQALFQEPFDENLERFQGDLVFINEEGYQEFLVHVVAVTYAIQTDGNPDDRDANLDKHNASQFIDRLKLSHAIHPSLRLSSDLVDLSAITCKDEVCQAVFINWVSQSATGASEHEGQNVRKDGNGAARDNPIVLDSDDEKNSGTLESFKLRVFEARSGSALDEITGAADQCMGCVIDDAFQESNFLRRSMRKRKTRYPVGVIVDEDSVPMSLNNNLAALRLCLMEQCTNGSVFELNHELALIVRRRASDTPILVDIDAEETPSEAQLPSSEPQLIPLPFDQNTRTLLEFCEPVLGASVTNKLSFDPSEVISVVRMPDMDITSKDISRDALMDHLIDLSNVATESRGNGTGSKPRGRAAERGFTGTLLSSAMPAVGITSLSSATVLATSVSPPRNASAAKFDDASEQPAPTKTPADSVANEGLAAKQSSSDDEVMEVKQPPPKVDNCGRVKKAPRLTKGEDLVIPSILQSIFEAPASGQEAASSDSDDSFKKLTEVKVPMSAQPRTRRRGAFGSKNTLGSKVLDLLRQNPDVTDSAASYRAAMWAAREGNLDREDDASKLVDIAYCKYLEEIIS
jgi:hypothetical protein